MQKGDLVRLTRRRDTLRRTQKAADVFGHTYDDIAVVLSTKERGWAAAPSYDIRIRWLATGELDAGSSDWFDLVETDDV